MSFNPLDLMGAATGNGGGGLSMATSDKLSSSGENQSGAYLPAISAPFNVGSGSASGSANASTGGGLSSWIPWAVAGAAALVAVVIYLRK